MGIGAIELFILLVTFGLGGQAGVPLGMSPGPEDPNIIKVAPADCIFYTNWSPAVAPDPKGNPTEQWMAQPEVQKSFATIKAALSKKAKPGVSRSAFELSEKLLTNSACVFISDIEWMMDGPKVEGGLLVHLGDDAKRYTDVLAEMFGNKGLFPFADVTSTTIQGMPFYHTPTDMPGDPSLHFGVVKEKYLAMAIGDGQMEKLLANLETEQPEWLSNVRGDLEVDRVSSVTYLNVETLIDRISDFEDMADKEMMDQIFETLGFNQVKTASWQSGLNKQGFICRGDIKFDGAPKGMFDLFADEGLEEKHLSRIANDRMVLVGASLSSEKIVNLIRELAVLDPFLRGQFDQMIEEINRQVGIDVETDILERLDGQAYFYGKINFAKPTSGWLLGIRVSDEAAFQGTFDKINEFAQEMSEQDEYTELVEKEVNGTKVFSMKDTQGYGMPEFSWAYANGEVLISMDKSSVRKHLRREPLDMDAMVRDQWISKIFDSERMDAEGPFVVSAFDAADMINVGLPLLTLFGDEMLGETFGLTTKDLPNSKVLTANMQPNLTSVFKTPQGYEIVQRQTYPGGTPGTLIGGMAVGGLASASAIGESAMRSQSANNARAQVLAMHNYHDANRKLPARFSKDAEDKPLLSWRVHILPYMGYSDLYNEFRLDEPWDSEHNKELLARMPDEYKHPMMELEDGKTTYVVAAGEDTALSDPSDDSKIPRGMGLENFRDGTSRTAIVLEVKAEHAVNWTEPDDLEFDGTDDAFEKLFQGWPGGKMNIAVADGSITYLSADHVKEIFAKMLKTSDGSVVELWER